MKMKMKINFNKIDPFSDLGLPIIYLNNINYIKGKSLNKKIYLNICFLFKTARFSILYVLFKIMQLYKVNLRTAQIQVYGRNYNIPIPVNSEKATNLLIQYIVKGSKLQNYTNYSHRLFNELDSLGHKYKKNYTTDFLNKLYFDIVENRTYAHYRWK